MSSAISEVIVVHSVLVRKAVAPLGPVLAPCTGL